MRRGLVLLGALLIAGAIAAQLAGASAPARRSSFERNISLPAPGGASVVLVKVQAAATKGAVGSLTATSLDKDRLPPGIRAIAMVTPPSSHERNATFNVYLANNNLTPSPAGDARISSGSPELSIETWDIRFVGDLKTGHHEAYIRTIKVSDLKFPRDCRQLVELGQLADRPYTGLPGVGGDIRLIKGANEPSNPEAILDFIAYKECKDQGAEVPDGDGPG